jgi:hypothetical protein
VRTTFSHQGNKPTHHISDRSPALRLKRGGENIQRRPVFASIPRYRANQEIAFPCRYHNAPETGLCAAIHFRIRAARRAGEPRMILCHCDRLIGSAHHAATLEAEIDFGRMWVTVIGADLARFPARNSNITFGNAS